MEDFEQAKKKLAVTIGLEFEANGALKIDFPFAKIQGINVRAYLTRHQNGMQLFTNFYITTDKNHCAVLDEEDDLQAFELFHRNFISRNDESIYDYNLRIVENIYDWVSQMLFDKLTSRFVLVKHDISNLFKSVFISPTIEFDFDSCCVCLESTQKLTPCGHFLCIECHCKLKKTSCDNDCNCSKKKCPICRANL